MADATTWIEVATGRVFRVPVETQLPMGDSVVRNLRGERLDVDLEALAEFEVAREEALRQLKDDVGGFLGEVGQNLRTESEKLEPTVKELGDRLRAAVNKAEVADSLDMLGDRLKNWARNMRGDTPAETEAPRSEQGHKVCPACFSLLIGVSEPCAACGHDFEEEGPVHMSPLEYGNADRKDCVSCGAPILARASRCEACGARQEKTL